jgi:hypothetical protein
VVHRDRVFGTLIILNGSLVAGATMIREKERGNGRAVADDAGQRARGRRRQDRPLFVLLMGMVGLRADAGAPRVSTSRSAAALLSS